jgi:hypothetical protein
MKQNKMAAVREVLNTNPDASPAEIVDLLGKQNIKITIGVASNYKSVIKSGAKRGNRKKRRAAKVAAAPAAQEVASSNGSGAHGLEPAVVELLKAGKSLGWKKVQSIVDLMSDLK